MVNTCRSRFSILTQDTYLVQISSDFSLVSRLDTRAERLQRMEIVMFFIKQDKGRTYKHLLECIKKILSILTRF